MYPWRLGKLGEPPLIGPELPSVHETRSELIDTRRSLGSDG
jgi:hypothetical protein